MGIKLAMTITICAFIGAQAYHVKLVTNIVALRLDFHVNISKI